MIVGAWRPRLRPPVTTSATRRRTLALLVAVVVAAVWIARDDALRARLLQLGGGSLSGRDRIWSAATSAFLDHPIFGIGFGHFRFQDPVLYDVFSRTDTTISTHNVPLQALVDFGAFGAAVLGVLVYQLVRPFWHPVIAAPLAALVAASLFGDVFAVVQVSWIIGLVLVTGLALARGGRRWARANP